MDTLEAGVCETQRTVTDEMSMMLELQGLERIHTLEVAGEHMRNNEDKPAVRAPRGRSFLPDRAAKTTKSAVYAKTNSRLSKSRRDVGTFHPSGKSCGL